VKVGGVAADLGCNAKSDVPFSHFGKANSVVAPVNLILHGVFPPADFFNGPAKVSIPFEGIHAEIKMYIEGENRLVHFRFSLRGITFKVSNHISRLLQKAEEE